MRAIAWDTWAFLETAFEGSRAAQVQALLKEADFVFTVREVVAESFNFIVKKTGRTEEGWRWWSALEESRVRILEPSLSDLHEFMGRHNRAGGLSFTDFALAYTASLEGATEIATEDAEFRRLRFSPIFAKR